VIVIGLGLGLTVFGQWVTTRGVRGFGWFAYSPLTQTPFIPHTGLDPWARMLVWIGLVLVWIVASALLLKGRAGEHGNNSGYD
jgi:heme/copper-type cytochrome/quinol oxidase subunit 1